MQNDLLRKLNVEIQLGLTKETQVVYLMTGIRKLIEQSDDSDQFGRLKFYCDWVVHSRLNRSPAQEVIKILQSVYDAMVEGVRLPSFSKAMLLIRFDLLKENLSTFLKKFELEDFTQNVNEWVVFIYLYSRVVADCPLEMPSNSTLNISRIFIQLETESQIVDDDLAYRVNWNFEAKGNLPPAVYFIMNTYSTTTIGRL